MTKAAIGIFDSGVGGTSILKEINSLLPHEHCIYLSDSKNAPYGNRSPEEIIALSVKNTELLLDKGVKLIVVACNTATTNAISHLRQNFNLSFVGIEPAIKPAALRSKTKTVGVLATKGTLSSKLFQSTAALHAQGIEIVEQIGDGIVPLIESGQLYSSEMRNLLLKYMKPLISKNIDYLVLGCTHYPYLIPQLKSILPESVTIVDSGLAVAKQTKSILQQNGLINLSNEPSEIRLYTNADIEVLRAFSKDNYRVRFLNF